MAGVVLKNIKKIYNKEVVAVDDFNLEIRDKEFVVFVGPSGCGKSTTLRMVAGLEQISEGECYIDDRLVNDVAPKDRDIAMVFQNYALYPHMTVFDNMAFALQLKKVPKEEIRKRVHAAAEILDISQYLKRKPKELSGGQRQRVAIGRAIVREPKVFLMDEPLSNLDAKLRNQMRAELIKLRKRVDTTFIYVTHDQTEAMTLGDRIVVMKGGIIQQVGTPQEVYTRPSNCFVAGFIGSPQMNFFHQGKLEQQAGRYFVSLFGRTLELPKNMQDILQERKAKRGNVNLGIRPEHIVPADKEDETAFLAHIEVEELMGAESFLHVTIEGESATVRISDPDGLSRRILHKEKESYIRLSFTPSKLHLFDSQTEESLLF